MKRQIARIWLWVRGPKWAPPAHAAAPEDWPRQYDEETRDWLYAEARQDMAKLEAGLGRVESRIAQLFSVSLLLVTASGIIGSQADRSGLTWALAASGAAVAVLTWWSAWEGYRGRRVELGPNFAVTTRLNPSTTRSDLRDLSLEVMRDAADDLSALAKFRGAWYRRQLWWLVVLAFLVLAQGLLL